MKKMVKKIEKAMMNFSKWDWAQTFNGDDGDVYEASSRESAMLIQDDGARERAMQYAEDVFDAVESATGSAKDAIDALNSGDLDDALLCLRDAATEESQFGDSIAYGPAIDTLEKIIEENEGSDMEDFEIREEGGQFVGVFNSENAPNEFLRKLIESAIENGGSATESDPEGCAVTATAV